ncbi:hypothetical protein N665_0023s0015 [Sinapis alba]|nr:hypothetical protein N665_0023s0015 [Sinapis alba]
MAKVAELGLSKTGPYLDQTHCKIPSKIVSSFATLKLVFVLVSACCGSPSDRITSPCHKVHLVSSSGSSPPRLCSTRLPLLDFPCFLSTLFSSVSSFFDFNESRDGEASKPASEEERKLRRRRHRSCSGGDTEARSRDDDVSCQGWRRPVIAQIIINRPQRNIGNIHELIRCNIDQDLQLTNRPCR